MNECLGSQSGLRQSRRPLLSGGWSSSPPFCTRTTIVFNCLLTVLHIWSLQLLYYVFFLYRMLLFCNFFIIEIKLILDVHNFILDYTYKIVTVQEGLQFKDSCGTVGVVYCCVPVDYGGKSLEPRAQTARSRQTQNSACTNKLIQNIYMKL